MNEPRTAPPLPPGPVAEPRLVVISGPSGAGKSSLAQRLLTDPAFGRAITATTRPARGTEQDGRDYHFLSEREFLRGIAAGDFLEHAEVYGGHRYGTPRKNVAAVRAAGRHCLLVIDIQGAATLRRLGVEALYVFLRAPDLTVLERRLRERGEDDEASIQTRLEAAERELGAAAHFDVQLINDDLEQAAQSLARLLDVDLEGA